MRRRAAGTLLPSDVLVRPSLAEGLGNREGGLGRMLWALPRTGVSAYKLPESYLKERLLWAQVHACCVPLASSCVLICETEARLRFHELLGD